MPEQTLEGACKVLANEKATWVDRRDAAVFLGKIAKQALTTLYNQRDDKDTDVRMAVQKVLEEVDESHPAHAVSAAPALSLKDLVMACAKPGEREIISEGDRFRVVMTLRDNRKQTVYVQPHKRKDGIRLVRVFTFCGHPAEDAYRWALEANMKLVQSAVGLAQHDGEEQFALLRCFLDGEITKPEMHAAIKEIGIYGDWIEQKMSGLDEL